MRLDFWWRHERLPLVALLVIAIVFATSQLDIAIARDLFFDAASRRWRGADTWWATDVIHTGGRWLVRCVIAIAVWLWVHTCRNRQWLPYRRPLAFFLVAVAATVGIIGFLKATTNIDCPWDLQAFGGRLPYIHLFTDRPSGLPTAKCFPAAHAGSGYAFIAIYFAVYERSCRWAVVGLGCGLLVGLVFGLAQQSRGAHFMSHDIWSAFIAWTTSLTIYVAGFKQQLWPKSGA